MILMKRVTNFCVYRPTGWRGVGAFKGKPLDSNSILEEV